MKSKLKEVSLAIFVILAIMILLLFLRQFIFVGIIFIFLVYLCRIWSNILFEDLAINALRNNAGLLKRDEILKRGPTTNTALRCLEQKKIIEIKDNTVYLINEDYKTAFYYRT